MSQLEANQAAELRKFKQWQCVETLVGCVWWENILYYFPKKVFKNKEIYTEFCPCCRCVFQSPPVTTNQDLSPHRLQASGVQCSAG